MRSFFVSSIILTFFFHGCSTVTYTPNNSIAISKEKGKEFVEQASHAKNIDEYANVLGYTKHDNYYTFVDKEPYNATAISWRTFAAFCRAQGGIVDSDPKFTQTKIKCPLPSFVPQTTKTHTTGVTYCKIPYPEDTTKMSASQILYVFYTSFKGDYPKGEDRLDVSVTNDVNVLSPLKVCYDNAYRASLELLDQNRINEAEQLKKKQEQDKLRALEQERQTALAQEKAAGDKKIHEQKIKEINAFRNSKLSEETMTNCGPILEVKKTMVKVYFPVKDYGNEHWISKNEIFPDGYGCIFRNGQYAGPSISY